MYFWYSTNLSGDRLTFRTSYCKSGNWRTCSQLPCPGRPGYHHSSTKAGVTKTSLITFLAPAITWGGLVALYFTGRRSCVQAPRWSLEGFSEQSLSVFSQGTLVSFYSPKHIHELVNWRLWISLRWECGREPCDGLRFPGCISCLEIKRLEKMNEWMNSQTLPTSCLWFKPQPATHIHIKKQSLLSDKVWHLE